MIMNLEKLLYEKFGYSSFRTGQKEIILDVLEGRNVLAMLPTGAGKSICYQLPANILKGSIVIVSPLISLMEDQVYQLKAAGEKRVIALNSVLSIHKKNEALRTLNKYKLIYVSPEVLQSSTIMKALTSINISLFVVDEAHCISQWGHEFRTDYLKLYEVIHALGSPATLALTATASKEVQKDIIEQLQLMNVSTHIYSIDRENIAIKVKTVEGGVDNKIDQTINYVKKFKGPGLIYFSSRHLADIMANRLRDCGVNGVASYHGGMESEDRLLVQQQFLNEQVNVICCTNAFGMGINKANIRFVIHFHFPGQLEAYIQEIGRAGRDGQPSIAILLYAKGDEEIPLHLIHSELPNEEEIDKTLQWFRENQYDISRWDRDTTTKVGEALQVSEVKLRFIRFQLEIFAKSMDDTHGPFFDPDIAKRNILETVAQRYQLKYSKLNNMKALIAEEECRRKKYLSFFDEEKLRSPKNCCDICGIQLEDFKRKTNTIENHQQFNWRKELQNIFGQGEWV